MKVAIDISPLESGHKVRGVGNYVSNLRASLLKYHPEKVFVFYDKKPSESVDLIHYPFFDPFFRTLPFIKKHKFVVTVHDLIPIVFPEHFPSGKKGNLIWKIQKRNLLKADRIITDSNASKADIVKYIGFHGSKIDVVYLAQSENFQKLSIINYQSSIMQKFHLPPKFALYVGDVTWNKNLPNLVRAIKNLDIPLVLVGKALGNPDYYSSNLWNTDLSFVNKETKSDKRFMKLGFVTDEELVELYNLAKLLIMPSIYEGFGLPVLEAMACGCPVVTSNVSSLTEIAGEAAYFVDPESVASITKGVATVFMDESLAEKLSKAGFLQSKKFSWKKTANETVKAYEKALSV